MWTNAIANIYVLFLKKNVSFLFNWFEIEQENVEKCKKNSW